MFEFTILDPAGKPDVRLGIDVDLHVRLAATARRLRLSILERFRDFYTDAEVKEDELDQFVAEINSVLSSLEMKDELAVFLSSLREVANRAKTRNQPLHGIAD